MDINNLSQMVGQLREQLARSQAEAESLRINGEAGGGMVKVVLNGRYEVVELKIEGTALEGDRALLEDLVRAAFNQASGQVAEAVKSKVGDFAQSFGIDLSNFGLGGDK